MSDMSNVVTQAVAKSFGLTENDTTEKVAVSAAVNQLNTEVMTSIYNIRQAAKQDGDDEWAELMLKYGKSLVKNDQ